MADFVTYCRVSTSRQGASGLGLEAQEQAVSHYASRVGGRIIGKYVEIESGSLSTRTQLASALAHCRRAKATLVIAKLDRLARNVAFVSHLMEAGVDFVAVDAPYANRLMLHILAAFAEHEREQISNRTKAALAAAKARGVRLGSNGAKLALKNQAVADEFAKQIAPQIECALTAGHHSLQSIADYLNRRGVCTSGNGQWYPTTVARITKRVSLARHCTANNS